MRRLPLLLLLFLWWPAQSHAAPVVIQHCTGDGNGASGVCTLTGVQQNSMLIVTCWRYNASACIISDTFGLSYTDTTICSSYNSGPSFNLMSIEYAYVGANSGSDTITGGNVITSTIIVAEVSGLQNAANDGYACAGQDTGVSPGGNISSGNFTTTANNNFIYAAGTSGAIDLSIGAGFTLDLSTVFTLGGSGGFVTEYKMAGAAGTYSGVEVQSGVGHSWLMSGIAFKTTSSGAIRHRAQVISYPQRKSRSIIRTGGNHAPTFIDYHNRAVIRRRILAG